MAFSGISGVVAVCFAFAILGQATAGVHHVLQTCATQEGTSLEEAMVFVNTGEATPGLKCGFKCVMKTINVINDDGTMQVDTMVALNPPDKADLVKKCSNLPPGDLCENAFLHYKCALENDPEYFKSTMNRLINDF